MTGLSSARMPELAEVLAPVSVFDCDGGRVRLGTLWADRACVLVFVRHFG